MCLNITLHTEIKKKNHHIRIMALPLLLSLLHFLQQISVAVVIANCYELISCVKMEGKNTVS